MTNPSAPTLLDPKLIDLALSEISTQLTTSLSWLNTAYGQAERRVFEKGNKNYIAPAFYSGGNDHTQLFPDEHLGCFSFFKVKDGSSLEADRINVVGSAEVSLIVWFKFKKVYPDSHERKNTRHVIKEVIDVLRNNSFTHSSIKIQKVFEEGQNIYDGYSDKEIETQFLMRPFGGFRIQMQLIYSQTSC